LLRKWELCGDQKEVQEGTNLHLYFGILARSEREKAADADALSTAG
jgi:hypothetical protein